MQFISCKPQVSWKKTRAKLALLEIHCRKIVVILVLTLLSVVAVTVAKLFHGCQLGYEPWFITYNCAIVLP